jgi:hypothetical protein
MESIYFDQITNRYGLGECLGSLVGLYGLTYVHRASNLSAYFDRFRAIEGCRHAGCEDIFRAITRETIAAFAARGVRRSPLMPLKSAPAHSSESRRVETDR